MSKIVGGNALFYDDGRHRWLLTRDPGGDGPVMSIGMINPSLAGREKNDPTVTKVEGFGRRLGVSKIILWNKHAAITPYVKELHDHPDPVGAENDHYTLMALRQSSIHVVAWGPLSKVPKSLHWRHLKVLELLRYVGVKPMCWDVAKDGQPKHPLMLPYSLELKPWAPV